MLGVQDRKNLKQKWEQPTARARRARDLCLFLASVVDMARLPKFLVGDVAGCIMRIARATEASRKDFVTRAERGKERDACCIIAKAKAINDKQVGRSVRPKHRSWQGEVRLELNHVTKAVTWPTCF